MLGRSLRFFHIYFICFVYLGGGGVEISNYQLTAVPDSLFARQRCISSHRRLETPAKNLSCITIPSQKKK